MDIIVRVAEVVRFAVDTYLFVGVSTFLMSVAKTFEHNRDEASRSWFFFPVMMMLHGLTYILLWPKFLYEAFHDTE